MRPLVWPGVKMRCKCCGGARFVVVWTPAWQPSPCPWRVGQHPPAGPLRGWVGGLCPVPDCWAHLSSLFSARSAFNKHLVRFHLLRLPATERTSLRFWVVSLSLVHTCSTSIRKCSALGRRMGTLGWQAWPHHVTSHNSPLCRWCRCRDQLSTGIEKIRGVSLILCLKTCQNIENCLLLARSGCLDPVSGLC